VNRVRRRIDAYSRKPLLADRRGAGYLLSSSPDPSVSSPERKTRRWVHAETESIHAERAMLDSVRVRLTLWYTAVLAVVLVACCL